MAALTAAVAFFSRQGQAQTQSDEARRSTLIQQATQARTEGRWSQVAELLQQVIALRPSASVRLGLSGALQELGRYQEASTQATLCMQTASTDRDLREEQRTALVDSCGRVLREVTANLANVTVEVTPEGVAGTSLSVDGESVDGFAPGRPFYVTPGRRRLLLQAPGHQSSEVSETLRAGVGSAVRMQLGPAVAPSLPVAAMVAPSPAPSSSLSPAPWIVGGIGVAAMGVGVGFLFWAKGASDSARSLCSEGCPMEDFARVEEFNTQQSERSSVGIALLAVGGAGLVASTIWILVRGPSRAPARQSVFISPGSLTVHF